MILAQKNFSLGIFRVACELTMKKSKENIAIGSYLRIVIEMKFLNLVSLIESFGRENLISEIVGNMYMNITITIATKICVDSSKAQGKVTFGKENSTKVSIDIKSKQEEIKICVHSFKVL